MNWFGKFVVRCHAIVQSILIKFDYNYEVFYSVSNEISALYENKNGKETSYDLGFPVGWRDQHTH
jgi:hypothetical protein